jgi:hypothetical protein
MRRNLACSIQERKQRRANWEEIQPEALAIIEGSGCAKIQVAQLKLPERLYPKRQRAAQFLSYDGRMQFR